MTAARSSIRSEIRKTLHEVARFYDQRKVGDVGSLGFRRSSDLARLTDCLDKMMKRGLLTPGHSRFLDLGCADGRVNVLLSYLVAVSVGIEMDEWTLDEYEPLENELREILLQTNLPLPPRNIFLFHGDSMDEALHEAVRKETGTGFEQFDLFYTYLTMQKEFAQLIARKARPGAVFMVYGLENILPKFRGLRLLTPQRSMEGILALYRKE